MSRDFTQTRCRVAVRLGEARTADRPECWVLATRPLEALDDFVRTHHDSLADRLEFAVMTTGKGVRVILRCYPAHDGPPTLPFADGRYVSLFKLPNVCVPCDGRLTPPLRRDLLREWLSRKAEFTWLEPVGRRGFRVNRVSLEAFRPLAEWVTYTRPEPCVRQPLAVATAFLTPEPFAVMEVAKTKPQKEPTARQDVEILIDPPRTIPTVTKGTAPPKPQALSPVEVPPAPAVPPAEKVLAELRMLEQCFRNAKEPLDSFTRRQWWANLARLYQLAGLEEEVDRCWAFAVWEHDGDSEWMQPSWLGEWASSREVALKAAVGIARRKREPSADELRTLAVFLIQDTIPRRRCSFPPALIPAVTTLLEEHENRLPIRVAWLTWLALAKIAGNDVLALTRARDRLLRDLMDHGLRRDRDLPLVLQTSGGRPGLGAETDTVLFMRTREKAWEWCHRGQAGRPAEKMSVLRVFVDLTVAAALARFGDTDTARVLLDESAKRWEQDAAKQATLGHHWVYTAYAERVRQSCRGEPAHAPLPAGLRRDLGVLDKENRETAERYLQFSRVLEPFERIDPYRNSHFRDDDIQHALNAISSLTPPANRKRRAESYAEELEAKFRELMKKPHSPRNTLRVLAAAFPVAARVGESFAFDCHALLEKTLPKADRPLDVPDIARRVELLETAAVTLAHFGRAALVGGLLEELRKMIRAQKGEMAALFARATGGGSYRFMARVGLQEPAKELLAETAYAFMGKQTVSEVMARPALNRGVFVPAFTKLAAGWFYFGEIDKAKDAVEVIREEIFSADTRPDLKADLAAAYAVALGMAPRPFAVEHHDELFAQLELFRNTYVYFDRMAIQHLTVIEAVALSLSADDFTADAKTRRWLDEDEFLVRRRIHRDVEEARKLAGL